MDVYQDTGLAVTSAICSSRPRFMIATSWEIESASSWSCVTMRNVVPVSVWMRSGAWRSLTGRATPSM